MSDDRTARGPAPWSARETGISTGLFFLSPFVGLEYAGLSAIPSAPFLAKAAATLASFVAGTAILFGAIDGAYTARMGSNALIESSSGSSSLVEVVGNGHPAHAAFETMHSNAFSALTAWGVIEAVSTPLPSRYELRVKAPYGSSTAECAYDYGRPPLLPAGTLALPPGLPVRISIPGNSDVRDPNLHATLDTLCRQEYAKDPLSTLQR